MEVQEVYINMDDSGKLSTKENYSVFGGVLFLSKKEKDKFITQYRKISNDIQCSYCSQDKNICGHSDCPEIKSSKIRNSHKRRLINYIKKYRTFACVINNSEVYPHIINNKASKGRYIDYVQKMLIKQIFKDLIKDGLIDPFKPVKLILNIDEQTTKSNGYYNLKESIIEEFLYGISNYNYSMKTKPILFNSFEVCLNYQDSSQSYTIQASDFVAGMVRKLAIDCNNGMYDNLFQALSIVDFKMFFPR